MALNALADSFLPQPEKCLKGLMSNSVRVLPCYICRPHEHGEDMLAPMSAVLNDYSEQYHSSAVCIVLRGLYALCEAEVQLVSLTSLTDEVFLVPRFLVTRHCDGGKPHLKLCIVENKLFMTFAVFARVPECQKLKM